MSSRRAGQVEVVAVAVVVAAVWYFVMGWDWSVVRSHADPNAYHAPQTGLNWTVLYLVAIAATGWLALRGRPVAGALAVAVPVVVLSGWRMAVATVIGANMWPIGLAALAVTLGAACAGAALVGSRVRRNRASMH